MERENKWQTDKEFEKYERHIEKWKGKMITIDEFFKRGTMCDEEYSCTDIHCGECPLYGNVCIEFFNGLGRRLYKLGTNLGYLPTKEPPKKFKQMVRITLEKEGEEVSMCGELFEIEIRHDHYKEEVIE